MEPTFTNLCASFVIANKTQHNSTSFAFVIRDEEGKEEFRLEYLPFLKFFHIFAMLLWYCLCVEGGDRGVSEREKKEKEREKDREANTNRQGQGARQTDRQTDRQTIIYRHKTYIQTNKNFH